MSEEDKLKTNNEKVTINDYYYYYLLKCEDALNELEKWLEEQLMYFNENNKEGGFSTNVEDLEMVIEKLQELKGSNGAIPPEVIGANGEDGGLFDYGDR